MGISKTDNYTFEQLELSKLAKVLGHPARIAILEFLIQKKKCICGDIVDELPLAQPTVSQHLKEMKAVGLIKGNIEGNSICYCIDEKVLQMLLIYIQNISEKLEIKNKCC
jgi:DNA-binding transcriptional ArsR family regulator